MCRDIANGGRRCPSHSNPNLVANRNAKRRKLYAKTKLVTKKVTKAQVEKIVSEPLNLKQVDNNVSGLVDYTKLDKNSYKSFGFQDISEPRTTIRDPEEIKKLSAKEVEPLDLAEQAALRFFTSQEYGWLNAALYGKGKHLTKDAPENNIEHTPYFQGDILHRETIEYAPQLLNDQKTTAMLKETTDLMDAALTKAPGKQRILYRGLYSGNSLFRDYGNHPDGPVVGYVEANFKLGQEMIIDGYQSTSVDSDQGVGYSGEDDGLVMEILTPSGVNVTSISEHPHEKEVILPRNTRYMVVGIHKKIKYQANMYNGPWTTVVQLVEINQDGTVATTPNKKKKALTVKQKYGRNPGSSRTKL